MSYLALYRKWRPINFQGIVGQDVIIRTLKNALIKERVSHAYLFSGIRGTGKTSTAKLLAKAVNCLDLQDGEPCNQCENCIKINEHTFMDIIEIDAASNRGIDEIRDIREKIKFHPIEGKVKIYIIDEVHMLTGEAFNALLKILEEPPEHVVFILATTELQKIPLTVISRCQRYNFRKISFDILRNHLKMISKDSGIKITEEALNLMTKLAGGGLRDGISLLDQCITSSDNIITGEQVAAVSGIVDDETLTNLLKTIGEGATAETIKEYEILKEKGKSIGQLLKDLMESFKNMLLLKTVKNASDYIIYSEEAIIKYKEISNLFNKKDLLKWIYTLGELEGQLKYSTHPDILLEVTLLKGVYNELMEEFKLNTEPKKKRIKVTGKSIVPETNDGIIPAVKAKTTGDVIGRSNEVTINTGPVKEINKTIIAKNDVIVLWESFLETLKRVKPLSYPFYVEGKAIAIEDNNLFVAYDKKYTFHKERGETNKHKTNAEEILSQVAGKSMKILLQFKTAEAKKEFSTEGKIKDIFGEDVTFIDS